MSAEEEFEKTAQEMDAQKTDVIEGLAAGETLEMPEAVDTKVAAIEAQADPETAQSVPEATEATQTGPEAAEDEDEEYEKKKAPLPFWTRGKVAAVGGIAAALVVGVVGIAAISLPQADATSDAPAKVAQNAEAPKTSVAKTGENAPASDVGPAAEATANVAQAKADPAQPNAVPEGETAAAGENAAISADATKGSDTASAAPSSGGSQASSKPSNSTGSSSSTTPKSESKPAASEPKKEQHVHSWEPVYEKKWIENWVTVDNNDAWDEPVYDGVQVCNKCGTQFSSDSEAAVHREEYALKGEGGHSSYVKRVQVDTIHHPSTTSQKDEGHYENVKVGEKCSGCGVTK